MAELGSSADDGRQFGWTAALTVAERQYTTQKGQRTFLEAVTQCAAAGGAYSTHQETNRALV